MYEFFPPAPVLDGAEPCQTCHGSGDMPYNRTRANVRSIGRVVSVRWACDNCGGCGRAEHKKCPANSHSGGSWINPFESGYDFVDLNATGTPECQLCRGRRFEYVATLEEVGEEMWTFYLRMPCACAGDLLRVKTDDDKTPA
uniref:Uncharacterized protein n=1 Tax=Streptomyces sp. NBC_00049 TaxID=2903617 RepID=A0AAU2JLH4_9ACTN